MIYQNFFARLRSSKRSRLCAGAGGDRVDPGAGRYVGAARSTRRCQVPSAAHHGHWSVFAPRRRECQCECAQPLHLLWKCVISYGRILGDSLAAFHIEIPTLSCAAHHFEIHDLACLFPQSSRTSQPKLISFVARV